MNDVLVDRLRQLSSVVVAFSGGVDSSVVAAAAVRSGVPCIAVTAVSPSVAAWQAKLARQVASAIGIEHVIVHTDELSRTEYQVNAPDRCFHCKSTLYEFLTPIAARRNAVIVSGTNADDLGDHRPGIIAGRNAGVQTPLADLGIDKAGVRRLAREFGLSNAELPASPCLSSRIAYGVEVTIERLRRIENAEDWLRSRGIGDCRVRLHSDELARIEVMAEDLPRLLELRREGLTDAFRTFGFRYTTVDWEGFRSGSLNESLVQLSTSAKPMLAPEVAS